MNTTRKMRFLNIDDDDYDYDYSDDDKKKAMVFFKWKKIVFDYNTFLQL